MSYLQWDNEYSVNINLIDEQHKGLFDLLNDLYDAVVTGEGREETARILRELHDYAETHFSDEENLMGEHNFSGLDKHKSIHEGFVLKLKNRPNEGIKLLAG